MKAMIFAAGLGTRLRPLTDSKPKALVELGGVAMLERVIIKLKNAGITEFVINVHHFSWQIMDFLKTNNNFGVTIHISDESGQLLDTGGGILKAREWLDDNSPFIVHNADIYTDFPINEMMKAHIDRNADVTLLVSERVTSRYLLFDKNGRMTGWKNMTTGEIRSPHDLSEESDWHQLAFGGVHILNPSVFPLLKMYAVDSDKFSITPFYVDYCEKLDIRGFQPSNEYNWVDIGRIESLRIAESIVAKP